MQFRNHNDEAYFYLIQILPFIAMAPFVLFWLLFLHQILTDKDLPTRKKIVISAYTSIGFPIVIAYVAFNKLKAQPVTPYFWYCVLLLLLSSLALYFFL